MKIRVHYVLELLEHVCTVLLRCAHDWVQLLSEHNGLFKMTMEGDNYYWQAQYIESVKSTGNGDVMIFLNMQVTFCLFPVDGEFLIYGSGRFLGVFVAHRFTYRWPRYSKVRCCQTRGAPH